jgi:hypothetical protein
MKEHAKQPQSTTGMTAKTWTDVGTAVTTSQKCLLENMADGVVPR